MIHSYSWSGLDLAAGIQKPQFFHFATKPLNLVANALLTLLNLYYGMIHFFTKYLALPTKAEKLGARWLPFIFS